MAVFQNALILAPSYLSSFFSPDLGQTEFQPNSAYTQTLGEYGKNGFILPNRFLAIFENPWLDEKFQFSARNFNTRLTLRCFTANVPSKYFSTHERDIAGPKRFIPYTTTYDELSMQFYCGQDMEELHFFQQWMDGILNPVTRYASYYDDYAKSSSITLLFMHNSLKSVQGMMSAYGSGNLTGIRFREVYPRVLSVNGGVVEWAQKTSPMFVNVTFGAREYVNIRTYDKEVQKQLERLNQSDLTNGLDDLLEQTEEQNAAFGGSVLQKELLKPTSSGYENINILPSPLPQNGSNVAIGGSVISTSQTTAIQAQNLPAIA